MLDFEKAREIKREIQKAVKDNKLALLECRDRDGEHQFVLCVFEDLGRRLKFRPITVILDENAIKDLRPLDNNTDPWLIHKDEFGDTFKEANNG